MRLIDLIEKVSLISIIFGFISLTGGVLLSAYLVGESTLGPYTNIPLTDGTRFAIFFWLLGILLFIISKRVENMGVVKK